MIDDEGTRLLGRHGRIEHVTDPGPLVLGSVRVVVILHPEGMLATGLIHDVRAALHGGVVTGGPAMEVSADGAACIGVPAEDEDLAAQVPKGHVRVPGRQPRPEAVQDRAHLRGPFGRVAICLLLVPDDDDGTLPGVSLHGQDKGVHHRLEADIGAILVMKQAHAPVHPRRSQVEGAYAAVP